MLAGFRLSDYFLWLLAVIWSLIMKTQDPNKPCMYCFTCTGLHVLELCDTPLFGSSLAAGHTHSDRAGHSLTGSPAHTNTLPPSSGRSPRSEKTHRRPGTCRHPPGRLRGEEEETLPALVFMKCLSAPPPLSRRCWGVFDFNEILSFWSALKCKI